MQIQEWAVRLFDSSVDTINHHRTPGTFYIDLKMESSDSSQRLPTGSPRIVRIVHFKAIYIFQSLESNWMAMAGRENTGIEVEFSPSPLWWVLQSYSVRPVSSFLTQWEQLKVESCRVTRMFELCLGIQDLKAVSNRTREKLALQG